MSFPPGVSLIDPSGGTGEGEVVTRTFKIHRFDPHPRRKMIIIQGELLVTVSSSVCHLVLAEDSREFKKLISLEGLSQAGGDKELIIDEIIKQCPFIGHDLRHHLAVTIEFVRNRKYDEAGMVPDPINISNASTPTGDFPEYFEAEAQSSQASEAELNEKVEMACLDRYVELLYEEDLIEKARGARCIGKLSKCPENLVAIAYHETALNALLRTLREDYRKSMDLTTHIMSVCLSYAQFTDFHKLLVTNKVCSVTFDLIEFELQRYEKWRLEVARRQDIVETRSEYPGSAGSFQKARNDFEKMRQKFAELTRKQDYLLSLAFDVILYMSENTALHLEIMTRGIVAMLMDTLGRKNIDLLKVVLKFLKNLSIFLPCKIQMAQLYIAEKLAQLLDANIPNETVNCCLQLLLNLSFDTKLRHKMVIFGVLPKLAFYLEDSVLETVTRKILYVMSMDRKVRPKFGMITHILPILVKTLQENKEEPARNSLDVAGILVNLAANKKCAQAMCENNGLVSLLQQAFESEDEIVMKIVRNLSDHQGTKALFAAYICDLARAIRDASSEDFVLECIGTLANLDLPNIDFCKLLEEFQLIPWIQSILTKLLNEDVIRSGSKDRVEGSSRLPLEVIVLTGTCCGDSECSDLLIQEGILDLLIKILVREMDPEIKSQVLYVFYKMCSNSGSKQYIQEATRIPKIVLELLQHENDQVQQICEGIMNLFGETDEAWMDRLREKRFRIYNEAWIEMTDRSVDGDDDPYGLAYGSTREKVVAEFPSSASDLMTEEESGDENSELEEGHPGGQGQVDGGGRRHDRIGGIREQDKSKAGSEGRSIFDRFKAQYEHEMRAKEQLDQKDYNSDDDEDDEEEVDEVSNSRLRPRSNRKKSASIRRKVDKKSKEF